MSGPTVPMSQAGSHPGHQSHSRRASGQRYGAAAGTNSGLADRAYPDLCSGPSGTARAGALVEHLGDQNHVHLKLATHSLVTLADPIQPLRQVIRSHSSSPSRFISIDRQPVGGDGLRGMHDDRSSGCNFCLKPWRSVSLQRRRTTDLDGIATAITGQYAPRL